MEEIGFWVDGKDTRGGNEEGNRIDFDGGGADFGSQWRRRLWLSAAGAAPIEASGGGRPCEPSGFGLSRCGETDLSEFALIYKNTLPRKKIKRQIYPIQFILQYNWEGNQINLLRLIKYTSSRMYRKKALKTRRYTF